MYTCVDGGGVTGGALFLCVEVTFILIMSLCAAHIILGILKTDSCNVFGMIYNFISVFNFLGASVAGTVRHFCGCRVNGGNKTRLGGLFGYTLVIRIMLTVLIILIIRSFNL